MIGIRTLLVSAASAVVLVPAAQAQTQYQSQAECESNRQGRQVAGAIFGAILGGVLGAEIEDEIDDRDNYRGRHHGGYRGHRGRGGRGYRGGRRHHYEQRHDNDVAVVAGAGLGALVGANVAGGQPCAPDYQTRDAGYYGNDYGYQDPYYDNTYSQTDYSYNDPYYRDEYGNDVYYGNEGLAGAPASTARVYQASTPQTDNCRWMTTRSQNQYGSVTANEVFMCQGIDGIWRPAQ